MGVTISSKNFSYDMGYISFGFFRQEIAKEVDINLGEIYKKFYLSMATSQEVCDYLNINEDKIKVNQKFVDFLFASDCDCELSSFKCKKILEVLNNVDSDKKFGYQGRESLGDKMLTINLFKEMLQDCVANKHKLTWF